MVPHAVAQVEEAEASEVSRCRIGAEASEPASAVVEREPGAGDADRVEEASADVALGRLLASERVDDDAGENRGGPG